jgi:signal peptidase
MIEQVKTENIAIVEKKRLIMLSFILVFYVLMKTLGTGLSDQGIIAALFWCVLCVYAYLDGNVRAHSKLKQKDFYLFFMLVCAVLYILSYLILGFVDGVGANIYDTSPFGIVRNILILGSVLVFRELVRSHIINAVEKKYMIPFSILIVVIFSLSSININALLELGSAEEWLTYLSTGVLPPLMYNAFMTVAVYIAGPLPAVVYALITNVPMWVIAVLPNLRWITALLINSLFPLMCIIVLRNVHKSKITRGRKRSIKEENPYSWIAVSVVMVMLVWFALGIFPVFPSIIVSNSMKPTISRGDLVFLKRTDTGGLEKGDVIQYKLEDIQVFHRIIEVKYNRGIRYFVTKGDANSAEDPNPVTEEQVMGEYIGRIPYVGWPALLLRQENQPTSIETGQYAQPDS